MPVQSDHPEVKDSDGNVTSAGFKCNDINSRLRDWASSMQAQPANTRYYGVVDDNGGTMFMRGCSEVGGTYGSGPSGNPQNFNNFKWDTDSTYADWYGGAEDRPPPRRPPPPPCPRPHPPRHAHPPPRRA